MSVYWRTGMRKLALSVGADLSLTELEIARWLIRQLTVERTPQRRKRLTNLGNTLLEAAQNPEHTGSDGTLCGTRWGAYRDALRAHNRFITSASILMDEDL